MVTDADLRRTDAIARKALALAGGGGGTGDVVGPAGATNDNPAVFDTATGKLLKEKTYAAFKALLALIAADVGLGNVNNTSDVNKPVSTAQQAAIDAVSAAVVIALALKADLASPALTGVPTAPTQDEDNDSTALATTEYVDRAIAEPVAEADFTNIVTTWLGEDEVAPSDSPWNSVLQDSPWDNIVI